MTDAFAKKYFDDILIIENNSNDSFTQIVYPENRVILGCIIKNDISEIINDQLLQLPTFTIDGQLTHHKKYLVSPGNKILLVKFKPYTASLFFPNLHETVNLTVSLLEFISTSRYNRLEDAFMNNSNHTSVIVDFLQRHLKSGQADESIIQAIKLAAYTKGQMNVNELARCIALSKRSFQRRFKASTGITAKIFLRNIRFQHSVNLLQTQQNLSDITHFSGYYDQPHFIREFKSITGITPRKYKSEFVTSVQL
ncbi:helix-turn-helix transcriptional regulator [Fulvivirga ligni]|uniref:helix-turn-helix transcriptional regulator n=1 Tax=Fulvivirga ligni TaxID=2904246 RepID=UPI001F48EB7A|nr:helix-turn-helix transcriptional regulator [Fulvivirga ligni]UII21714.1 helix-turn-helix transcriptional regulator [Fulvivirga ligni]